MRTWNDCHVFGWNVHKEFVIFLDPLLKDTEGCWRIKAESVLAPKEQNVLDSNHKQQLIVKFCKVGEFYETDI